MSSILEPTPENISRAASALAAGQVVALPTETVYGLGANAYDDDAVRKIFQIKGRPSNNPLIVHLSSLDNILLAADAAAVEKAARFLDQLARFIPGPLSFVIERNQKIATAVCAGLTTVAVRIPSHPVAAAILSQCSFPVAAPSANPSNYISPTSATHVSDQLGGSVDLIIDGGPCQVGIESTIIDLSRGAAKILRLGQVTAEQIADALSVPIEQLLTKEEKVLAPGMLKEHYAPRTPLALLREMPEISERRAGLLYLSASQPPAQLAAFQKSKALSSSGDLAEIARNLFKSMREFDSLGLDFIVVEECESAGIGRAILDRLMRARAKSVTE